MNQLLFAKVTFSGALREDGGEEIGKEASGKSSNSFPLRTATIRHAPLCCEVMMGFPFAFRDLAVTILAQSASTRECALT